MSGMGFYSVDYPDNDIIYWASDLWAQQTAEEKEESPRSEISSAYVTKADIAEMYDLKRGDVSEATYNGVAYFKVVTNADKEPRTKLVRFDNGWMYEFEFLGTETDVAYRDFEKILTSVKYPASSEETVKTEKTKVKSDHTTITIIAAVLAVLAAVGVVGFVAGITLENRKRQVQEQTGQETILACKECGHRLPGDSMFCQYCGTRIRKKVGTL